MIANVVMGVPSIIVGVFAFAILVKPVGHYSGFAGSVALAFIMLPVMARTTEDILNLVPNELRESGLAMGAPRWKVTLGVVCKAARGGLITGATLAVVRVAGETAPLLFTALSSPYWMHGAVRTGRLLRRPGRQPHQDHLRLRRHPVPGTGSRWPGAGRSSSSSPCSG